MVKSNNKIKCNYCGEINKKSKKDKECICKNCKNIIHESNLNKIDLELIDAIISSNEIKIVDLLTNNESKNNNSLLKCIQDIRNLKTDLSYIHDETDNLDIIVSYIVSTNDISKENKIKMIQSMNINNKNEIIESILENNFDEKKIEECFNYQYNIIKNIQKKSNLLVYQIIIGILMAISILIIGLFFKKEMATNIVIILSLIPSIFLGVILGGLLNFKKIFKIIITIIISIFLFVIISYLESIVFNGFVNVYSHLKNIINAIPTLIDQIYEHMTNTPGFEFEGE